MPSCLLSPPLTDFVGLATSPYPFSSTAHIPSPTRQTLAAPPASALTPRKGTAVIDHINSTLRKTYDPSSTLTNLFSRRHPERIRPGSIITVTSYTTPARTATSSFSGVLMGMRRRGVDTSFTLRNVINRLGVETSFKIYSPMIKEVKIVKRAEGGKGSGVKDLKRAKVNYLRDRAGLMEKIAGALKAGAQGGAQAKGKAKRR